VNPEAVLGTDICSPLTVVGTSNEQPLKETAPDEQLAGGGGGGITAQVAAVFIQFPFEHSLVSVPV
jgi:hypothetical protein